MQSSMKDASQMKTGKKKVRTKVLKESDFEAGLAALETLESTDVLPRPVTITARTLVREAVETIVRVRNRGIPLLRIYTDMRKAAGLTISFPTFSGYVSQAVKEKGLSFEKKKVSAPAAGLAEDTTASTAAEWKCPECPTASIRRESTKTPGAFFWKCGHCGTFYFDDNGKMTSRKMGG